MSKSTDAFKTVTAYVIGAAKSCRDSEKVSIIFHTSALFLTQMLQKMKSLNLL